MQLQITVPEILSQDPDFFQEYAQFLERIGKLQQQKVNPTPKQDYVPIDDAYVASLATLLIGLVRFPEAHLIKPVLPFFIKLVHCWQFHNFSYQNLIEDAYASKQLAGLICVMGSVFSVPDSMPAQPRRARKRPTFDGIKEEVEKEEVVVDDNHSNLTDPLGPFVQTIFTQILKEMHRPK